MNRLAITLFILTLSLLAPAAHSAEGEASVYARWKQGISSAPDYFPLAVWLQAPNNAAKYKALGINLYIGLWDGPKEDQLAALDKAGMPVICAQNELALKSLLNKVIVGWMHGDEPDNAQSLPGGKGYGPPILPEKIIADYDRIRKADPTRPVILNLGQGVAWDKWVGRGTRTNKPEDYPEYMKGGDIVSFDIYPASHDHKDVAGKLWYVAQGVERLVNWSKGEKIVWSCIETTQISSPGHAPTPQNIRSEVWMAIIRGARGIIYFAHEFKPKFIEAGLLTNAASCTAVKDVNQEVTALAPVLNSPSIENGVEVTSTNEAKIATMVKKHGGAVYVFAVNLSEKESAVTFKLKDSVGSKAEVLNEKRAVEAAAGKLEDKFEAYAVHLYKLVP